jgi:hypothetical protein
MRSGNIVMAHPNWLPTLLNPVTGEIREVEGVPHGTGMAG